MTHFCNIRVHTETTHMHSGGKKMKRFPLLTAVAWVCFLGREHSSHCRVNFQYHTLAWVIYSRRSGSGRASDGKRAKSKHVDWMICCGAPRQRAAEGQQCIFTRNFLLSSYILANKPHDFPKTSSFNSSLEEEAFIFDTYTLQKREMLFFTYCIPA